MERRHFVHKLACLSSAAAVAMWPEASDGDDAVADRFPVAIFTKVFQSHTFDQLAEVVVQTDADGVEATIRRGGHIEAENAEAQIDKLIAALANRHKRLLIAATDVNEVNADSERLLKTLADHGVSYYRTGYLKYRRGTPMLDQVRGFRQQISELADLNRSLGMTAIYQNHAGKDYVGNLIWDLAILMEGIVPADLGVALDLRHLRVEIAGSFQAAVEAIRPHLRSVYLKDALRTGEKGSELQEVPLGSGMVTPQLFQDVWRAIQPAPLSVHVEYLGQRPIPVDQNGAVVNAYRRDVATLRSWM